MSVRGAEGAGATGSEAKERRVSKAPRVHFEALVAVGETAGGGFEAESVDVSPDGMRLRTAFLPDVGDKLVCRFDGQGQELTADGEVIWRNEEAKGGEFGLRFKGLDAATEEAVRAMCASMNGTPAEEPAAADAPSVPRGARVRLHIEGLGSPMKARVRESAAREVEVGSNLEFLKVGRSLELEDVDKGEKREAMIDSVKVDVDPTTNVPQLVVTLRYEKAGASVPPPSSAKKKARVSTPPATRRTASAAAPAERATRSESEKTVRSEARDERDEAGHDRHDRHDGEEGGEHDDAPSFGARAASAGRAVAGKVGPAITGMGARAKVAMGGMMAIIERRRAERADPKKPVAARRTTAPPPGGGLTSDGRRLVRDEGFDEEDDAAAPPRTNRRAAATGGALGLIAVLAIFGMTRVMGGQAHTAAAGAPSALPAASTDATAALGTAPLPGTAPGTITVNVPLVGATPASTTELAAPGTPAPSAQASAAPGAPGTPGAPGADDGEDAEPGDGKSGPILKEWGKGTVAQHPVVLKIKMDGAIERITGAAGAQGFTISVPGHRSVSTATVDLARKDKRLSSVNVVNTSHGAEVSVQFKEDVPAYIAKVKGDKLEISIGKEGHSKIAKKHKKSKH